VVTENHLFCDYMGLIPTPSNGRYSLVDYRHIQIFSMQAIQKYSFRLPLTHYSHDDRKYNIFNGLNASDRVMRWILPLEEYEVTFEWLPGKMNKNVLTFLHVSSRLDTDRLKIQNIKEEALLLFSCLENSKISTIKLTFSNNTDLNFKEQEKWRVQD
jgi:hypothetical protein